MMMLANRNMRAIDRLFDRMTGFSGMSSPLAVVDNWFDNLERDVKIANGPEDGIVTRSQQAGVRNGLTIRGGRYGSPFS